MVIAIIMPQFYLVLRARTTPSQHRNSLGIIQIQQYQSMLKRWQTTFTPKCPNSLNGSLFQISVLTIMATT